MDGCNEIDMELKEERVERDERKKNRLHPSYFLKNQLSRLTQPTLKDDMTCVVDVRYQGS